MVTLRTAVGAPAHGPIPYLPPKSARVSLRFLKRGEHEQQDFNLPGNAHGIIGFTHKITHPRDRDVKATLTHEDRVSPGMCPTCFDVF